MTARVFSANEVKTGGCLLALSVEQRETQGSHLTQGSLGTMSGVISKTGYNRRKRDRSLEDGGGVKGACKPI